MLLAGLVVHQHALLKRVGHHRVCDVRIRLTSQRRGDFESVVRATGVATGIGGNFSQSVFVGPQVQIAQPALFVDQSPLQQAHNLLLAKRLQYIDAGARQQRRDNFERRILGGSPDQANASLLDVR